MSGQTGRAMRWVAVLLAGMVPWMLAEAQSGGADTLESQLGEKYKLAKLGTDSNGLAVTDAGTVLLIKKGGILSVASGNIVVVPTTVKDGEVQKANNTAMTGVNKLMKWKGLGGTSGASTDTKFLTVGEKVYATKITVNRKDSKVALNIIECDSCNSVQDPSSRQAQVVFEFPKGYLDGADGGQISDVINQILEIQADDSSQQQQQQTQDNQAQPAADQPAAQQPAAPPPTIQLGQTPDEVTALIGQPDKIVNLGAKQIYIYKDMKVTFVKGKVSDVQ